MNIVEIVGLPKHTLEPVAKKFWSHLFHCFNSIKFFDNFVGISTTKSTDWSLPGKSTLTVFLSLSISDHCALQVPLRAQKEASGVGDYADIKRLSVTPSHENPYAELGEVDCVNLLSFAYQIASGMVS